MDVVEFGAGEPDFPTPDHVKAAAHAAIDANFTKYTPAAGTGELKQAIATRYKNLYGIDCKANEVIVSAGGKQALYDIAIVLFGAGDEVITHAPDWPTLTEQVKLADATPVLVHTYAEEGFNDHRAADPRRRHAEHARGDHQLAVQSHRRADERRRDDAPGRRPQGHEHLGHRRPLLRAADLRAGAAQPAEDPVRPHARPHDPLRVGVEVVLDDRLALRLGRGPGGSDLGLQRPPEPLDVERLVDLAEGGVCGGDWTAGFRRRDAGRVPASGATPCMHG